MNSTDPVRETKSAKMSLRVIGIIVAIVIGLVALIIAYVARDQEMNKALSILKAIAVGVCSGCYALGVAYMIFYFMQKNSLNLLVGLLGLAVGTIILLLLVMIDLWWLIIILAAVFFAVIILLMLVANRQTVTLVADNARPDYKDYKTREAEKKNNPQPEEKEELPEIKSFKD